MSIYSGIKNITLRIAGHDSRWLSRSQSDLHDYRNTLMTEESSAFFDIDMRTISTLVHKVQCSFLISLRW